MTELALDSHLLYSMSSKISHTATPLPICTSYAFCLAANLFITEGPSSIAPQEVFANHPLHLAPQNYFSLSRISQPLLPDLAQGLTLLHPTGPLSGVLTAPATTPIKNRPSCVCPKLKRTHNHPVHICLPQPAPPPRWLISHQGDHQGQKTPRCGHSWAPEAAQMHLHPVHSPEQGSSSSCSRESPGGLPTCLGFTSRSWSRARFFSWGGGKGRGAPESPAPSHAQRENKRTPGTGALLPGSTEKLGSQTAPTYRAFSCPHPAQHSPPGR